MKNIRYYLKKSFVLGAGFIILLGVSGSPAQLNANSVANTGGAGVITCVLGGNGDCVVQTASQATTTGQISNTLLNLGTGAQSSPLDIIAGLAPIIGNTTQGSELLSQFGNLSPTLANVATSQLLAAAQQGLGQEGIENILKNLVSLDNLLPSLVTAAVQNIAGGGDLGSFAKLAFQQAVQRLNPSALASGAFNAQTVVNGIQKNAFDTAMTKGESAINLGPIKKCDNADGKLTLVQRGGAGHKGTDIQYATTQGKSQVATIFQSKGTASESAQEKIQPINLSLLAFLDCIDQSLGEGSTFAISSGFRTLAHNSGVSFTRKRGARLPNHVTKTAADFQVTTKGGKTLGKNEMALQACAVRNRLGASVGVGKYTNHAFVHVDMLGARSWIGKDSAPAFDRQCDGA